MIIWTERFLADSMGGRVLALIVWNGVKSGIVGGN